jgi:hypothetical protein
MTDLISRLRDTPNWMRESYGSWKDCVLKYDRAPFEAADEIERLTQELKKANDQAEHFEREWYLRGDALEVAVRQNEHDMLMTGEELRACRAALKEPT